ncbi:hypothetical protein AB0H57_21675 [Micromonospora sp. NPDC050686]|uniref:hypothetical protein n=1 Tax=Micromonospora sp. NPDC050686 TaxID=3154631 RepID=UPI00340EE3F4
MKTESELTVEAMAVAVEDGPPYLPVGEFPTDPEKLWEVLDEWAERAPAELRQVIERMGTGWAAVVIEFLSSVAAHIDIPKPVLRMLSVRADGTEIAEAALAALGAPRQPQPLLLVQATADRDTTAMLLPRLVHELAWPVTEELGVTHLGCSGGTAILDMLAWWVDPRVGATVIIVDQPQFVAADRLPERLSAVALRFGATGPLEVLGCGTEGSSGNVDYRFTGPGACGGWLDLHRALGNPRLRGGDRIVVQSRADDQAGWGLIRCKSVIGGRPLWWRPPVRVTGSR